MNKSVRILLVEDHDIVREGLRSLIEARAGYTVVAEASTGRQVLELARANAPHVVIMDINLPEMNGIEATRQLLEALPGSKVVGLSVHTGGRLVQELLNAGAAGYLPKSCAARELFVAIDTVMKGRLYRSPAIDAGVSTPEGGRLAPLTARERQVLQLLAEGRSTKEVALALKLVAATVHTHRQSIMRKLKCKSVVEAARLALREGLTSLDFA